MANKYSFFYLLIIFWHLPLTCLSITLNQRQLCDIELLLNGGFEPLTGFLNKEDYNSVVENMRLADGSLWPMPITLDVDEQTAQSVYQEDVVKLKTPEHLTVALLHIKDIWEPSKHKEAKHVFGTTDTAHPAVHYLFNKTKQFYIGGTLEKVNLPEHFDFTELRRTPAQLKKYFTKNNITRIVGFQTRNPMHRAHKEITTRAMQQTNTHLLIHPVVGMTKPGDVNYATRVRCYKKILNHYPDGSATLSLLPLAMRMAGPREALWHALIRKNYGCTHFIVGRDHAGPGKDSNGSPFYNPYDAQELVMQHAEEIGIEAIPFQEIAYVSNRDCYLAADEVTDEDIVQRISGTQFRALLRHGLEIPQWFSYPEIIEELQKVYRPNQLKGLTILLTGLSASGKSTLARALKQKLAEIQDRPITLFDGDIVRINLSKELGFSKKDRSTNMQRIGFVAQEITKNGGIAICALIAPYEADRIAVRNMVKQYGGFIEIYVSTPLSICEKRDPKKLYKKARQGIINNFTGIDDPYEEPQNAELCIDASECTISESLDRCLCHLKKEGYLK